VRIAALASIALALATLTAVAHGAGSSNAGFRIFEVRIEGTGHRVLLKKMRGYGTDTPVDISRDGKRMLFVRGGGLPAGLYVANVDGSHPRRVASNNSIVNPVFSPDGRKAAFEGAFTCVEPDRCYDSDIWIVNTDGTRLRRVAKFATAPSWSADSKKLAWVGRWSITTEQGVIMVGRVPGQLREREITGGTRGRVEDRVVASWRQACVHGPRRPPSPHRQGVRRSAARRPRAVQRLRADLVAVRVEACVHEVGSERRVRRARRRSRAPLAIRRAQSALVAKRPLDRLPARRSVRAALRHPTDWARPPRGHPRAVRRQLRPGRLVSGQRAAHLLAPPLEG